MWLTRKELPGLKKLDIVFDIERLRDEYELFAKDHSWLGLDNEYEGLCRSHQTVRPKFGKTSDDFNQIPLSVFDDAFSLDDREEKSRSIWDKKIVKNNPEADERYYRKPIENIPKYTAEVLDYFRPYLHRVRFSRLMAGHEILPHTDYDTRYSIRLHIPIITAEECIVGCGKKEEHWPADGHVYFMNPGLEHWVKNNSDIDRVHLVMSIDSQKFI